VSDTTLPEPSFIDRNQQAVQADIVALYEQLSGHALDPAHVDRVMLDVIAYRETLLRVAINEAAKQNLLAYSRAPVLDYLAELRGVQRLPAAAATVTLRFILPAAATASVLIPAGTRAHNGAGLFFSTTDDALIAIGQSSVDVPALCETEGAAGNGWLPGQVKTLFEPLAAAPGMTVSNVTASANGSPPESDDQLRVRIKLASMIFSTAGPSKAYEYYARSAHPSIVDVWATSLAPEDSGYTPGNVKLYVLVSTGLPDAALLSMVLAACNDEQVRPINDVPEALAPTAVNYAINATLTLEPDAEAASTLAAAQAAASTFAAARSASLGISLVDVQLTKALQVDGVSDVTLNASIAASLTRSQWAKCTAITINLVGV
jgi:phage-related baseplate assembly protein